MPEQTPPNDASKSSDAEQAPAGDASKTDDARRAELEKLTKRELLDRLAIAEADIAARDRVGAEVARHFAEPERHRARPEDAFVVSALLDLHRTVGAERQGPTLRGRQPAVSPRYLEAARTLGDKLVDAILGPNAKV